MFIHGTITRVKKFNPRVFADKENPFKGQCIGHILKFSLTKGQFFNRKTPNKSLIGYCGAVDFWPTSVQTVLMPCKLND